MAEPEEIEESGDGPAGIVGKLGGLAQKIIGEVEIVGGALTGDPLTEAEGELNVEVGEMREEMERAQALDDPDR